MPKISDLFVLRTESCHFHKIFVISPGAAARIWWCNSNRGASKSTGLKGGMSIPPRDWDAGLPGVEHEGVVMGLNGGGDARGDDGGGVLGAEDEGI
jgi:hypothetical protein